MWPRLKTWIVHHEPILYALILLIILRLPSLFEPYWYGDEGIYLTIGQALHHGVELYKGIHDNKPPLLYLVAALSGGTLFWFKFCALLANVCTLVIFSRLALAWWGKGKAAALSLIIFTLLISLPFFEGNIANAENFFILFTALAFYLLFVKPHKFYLALAGLALGTAGLFKMPAILEAAIWPVFWLLTKDRHWFKKSLVFGVATLTPLVLTILYFASRGSLNSYLIAAGLQNVPYLVSWQANVFLLGSLKARSVILVILIGLIWIFRSVLDKKVLLLVLWLLISLFAALLSGRPYPHYLLQLAPAAALAAGYVFDRKKIIVPGTLILVLWTIITLFGFHLYPTLAYYKNFISWASNRQDLTSYYAWFSPNVNADYETARVIMQASKPTDRIFVWGDVPVIYALSKRLPVGKYTVKYHISDFGAQAETLAALRASPPRFIVIFDNPTALAELPMLLQDNYVWERQIGSAQIYRRLAY